MQTSRLLSVLGLLSSLDLIHAQSCANNNYGLTCASPNGAYCPQGSLKSNIISRCSNGCVQLGNCNGNLANVPPYGAKLTALCWEESPGAGNAQCTIDCVAVTALNGSSVYPVGCSFTKTNTTSPASSISLSLTTPSSISPLSASASKTSLAPSSTSSAAAAGSHGVGAGGLGLGLVVMLGYAL